MGRPRKPIAQHILEATFRADEHAHRLPVLDCTGEPERPPGLHPDAVRVWDLVTSELVPRGAAKRIDSPLLESLCWWWAEQVRLMRVVEADVGDWKARRGAAEATRMVLAIGSRFGLTPVDREKLRAEVAREAEPSIPTRSRN